MNLPIKKVIVFITCILISFSIFIGRLPSWNSDPYGTLVVSQNIIQNHTLNLNHVKQYWKLGNGSYNWQVYQKNNNVYYSYPLGTPIISLPLVYIANTFGLNMLKYERVMQEVLCSIVAIGIFLTIFLISLEYFSFVYAIIIGLMGFYGTTIGTVVGTGLWNLDYDLFFSGLAILLIFLSVKENYKIHLKKIEISSILIGIFIFLAFISRPTVSILIFFIFIFLILYDKKFFTKIAITSWLLFMSYELFLYVNTKNMLNHGYALTSFSTMNFNIALEGFVLSPGRSILIFDPFLLMLPIGMYYMISKKNTGSKKIEYLIFFLLISAFITSIFLLFWTDWYGGGSYGPRIFTDAIYWYFLLTIISLGEILNTKTVHKRAIQSIFFSLMAIGFLINIQGIYNKFALDWNAYPNVDAYQNKVLFDWRFPQFLMTKKNLAKKYITQGTELGIFNKNEIYINMRIIHMAVLRYLKKTNNVKDLYPLYLENLGFLDKSFGGYPEDKPNNNWTKNGYWIGAWGDSYAIGCAPVDSDIAKFLFDAYSKQAKAIYFPYPKQYNPKTINNNEVGQILIVFKHPNP